MDGNRSGLKDGYLTVYLALTMTVMLSMCLALIEGVRSNAIRVELECVTSIALDSILAEYHQELLRQYNLFAIDGSYGTELAGIEQTQTHLQQCMDKNFSGESVFLWDQLYKDFFAISVDDCNLTGVSILTDEKGSVFRRNAAQVAWEEGGVYLLQEVWEWMDVVESNRLTEASITGKMKDVDQQIQTYDGQEIQISETEWEIVDVENPAKGMEEIRKQGVLKSVLKDEALLSVKGINTENLVSDRVAKGVINRGNLEIGTLTEGEQMLERYYFQEYLLNYFGYFGKEKEEGALSYQIEYALFGNDTDVENMKEMVNKLCVIREGANVLYLYSDEEKRTQAKAAAVAAAALIRMPQLSSLFENALMLGWAYAESLHDVEVLLSGGKVPLIKDSTSWYYSLEKALYLGKEDEEALPQEGLHYTDYLRLFMLLENEVELTLRAMDMVECDIRMTEGNNTFRVDNCFYEVECEVQAGSAYGYEYEIVRKRGYY